MTDATMWKKMGKMVDMPSYLLEFDDCFYAREYVARGGYKASETNSLITNFKIDVCHRSNSKRWYHKKQAVLQFARELAGLLKGEEDIFVTAIPPSKRPDAEDYDPRFSMMFQQLCRLRNNVHVISPVERQVSCQAVHHQDQRPSIEDRYTSLVWKGVTEDVPHIVFVDDVVTTGATFKACQRIVRENASQIDVYGVFWARTVWPAESQPLNDVEHS